MFCKVHRPALACLKISIMCPLSNSKTPFRKPANSVTLDSFLHNSIKLSKLLMCSYSTPGHFVVSFINRGLVSKKFITVVKMSFVHTLPALVSCVRSGIILDACANVCVHAVLMATL